MTDDGSKRAQTPAEKALLAERHDDGDGRNATWHMSVNRMESMLAAIRQQALPATPDPTVGREALRQFITDWRALPAFDGHEGFSPAVMLVERFIAAAPSSTPGDGLDARVLWGVLAGVGVLDNGTWVAFTEADATAIAEAYAAEYARLTRERAEGDGT